LLFKSEGGHGLRRRTRTLALSWPFFFGIFACSSGNIQAMEGIAGARRTSRPANRVKTRGMGGDSGHAPWPARGPLFRLFVCLLGGWLFFLARSGDRRMTPRLGGGDTNDGWTGRAVDQAGEGRVPDNPMGLFFRALAAPFGDL
jgi:hypothetical protein